ncbi:MAG: hypothetical protein EKK53_24210 [Burkholderiales bacterium]|nr:MAG: hypothetical protein EKK53_24210 [Burkholderiales bacterium]
MQTVPHLLAADAASPAVLQDSVLGFGLGFGTGYCVPPPPPPPLPPPPPPPTSTSTPPPQALRRAAVLTASKRLANRAGKRMKVSWDAGSTPAAARC